VIAFPSVWIEANRASGARFDSLGVCRSRCLLYSVLSRLLNLSLLVRKRRMPMTTKHNYDVFAASVLDSVSGIGTGIVAGATLA
jgi:hypothetical protein